LTVEVPAKQVCSPVGDRCAQLKTPPTLTNLW